MVLIMWSPVQNSLVLQINMQNYDFLSESFIYE